MNRGLLRYPEGGKHREFILRWERSVAGTYTWLCPDGVSLVRVTCIGGGGGGGGGVESAGFGGGGGGGAGGTAIGLLQVVSGKLYTIVVGAKGAGTATATAGTS